MTSDPGNIGRKLLIFVRHAMKRLKIMSRGLLIAHLIARFCLKILFLGGSNQVSPPDGWQSNSLQVLFCLIP